MTRMRLKREMREWLTIYRWSYKDRFAALVLKKGRWFLGRSESNDYPSTQAWKERWNPPRGECYRNAQRFCLSTPEVRYFEGYMLIGETPIAHAWNVMEDAKVVDFTFEAADDGNLMEKGYRESYAPLYLGIEVERDDLSETGEPNVKS